MSRGERGTSIYRADKLKAVFEPVAVYAQEKNIIPRLADYHSMYKLQNVSTMLAKNPLVFCKRFCYFLKAFFS